jgi:nucleoside phosphorylase
VKGSSTFVPDPKSIPLALDLKEKFQHIQAKGQIIHDVTNRWRGGIPLGNVQMVIGPMASGASVIQDEAIVEEVKAHSRKLAAIDMEAYGVVYAAENCTKPRPTALIVKSICDFADELKGDDFQGFAAFASANVLYEFCLCEIEPLRPQAATEV